jgi:uncharacterized protein (DUF58 family)
VPTGSGIAKIGTAAVGTRHVALSGRGRIFVAVGIISTLAGLILGVLDLQRVGVLLLVLPIPAWLAVRQARSGLRVGHSVSPPRTVVGSRAEVRLVLGNPHTFGTGPLKITETVPGGRPLRFSVAGVRGRQRRTVAYPLPALRRGRYTVGPTAVTASDPFGLVIADTRSTDTAELIVQPECVELAPLTLPIAWRDGATTLSHSVGVGGSDDASVRTYRHGDDLRKIHWRSTARSGALMVRQEERPWHGESLVLLDSRAHAFPISATETESAAFEWAVSAAASIACHLAERGRRVVVVNGAGKLASDDRNSILDMLADTKPALRNDVEPLADAVAGLGRDASTFAVLAALDRGPIKGLANRPRMPGSAVALLLRPWTFTAGTVGTAGHVGAVGTGGTVGRNVAGEAAWHEAADALRGGGWRVVGVAGGDELATLWPTLLASRVGPPR